MTQPEFYRCRQWRQLSKAYLLSKYYICERCGKPAVIAHHKKYLTPANVNNPTISLNPSNLEALCMDCHNAEHFGTGGATAQGFAFDAEGNLIQVQKERFLP